MKVTFEHPVVAWHCTHRIDDDDPWSHDAVVAALPMVENHAAVCPHDRGGHGALPNRTASSMVLADAAVLIWGRCSAAEIAAVGAEAAALLGIGVSQRPEFLNRSVPCPLRVVIVTPAAQAIVAADPSSISACNAFFNACPTNRVDWTVTESLTATVRVDTVENERALAEQLQAALLANRRNPCCVISATSESDLRAAVAAVESVTQKAMVSRRAAWCDGKLSAPSEAWAASQTASGPTSYAVPSVLSSLSASALRGDVALCVGDRPIFTGQKKSVGQPPTPSGGSVRPPMHGGASTHGVMFNLHSPAMAATLTPPQFRPNMYHGDPVQPMWLVQSSVRNTQLLDFVASSVGGADCSPAQDHLLVLRLPFHASKDRTRDVADALHRRAADAGCHETSPLVPCTVRSCGIAASKGWVTAVRTVGGGAVGGGHLELMVSIPEPVDATAMLLTDAPWFPLCATSASHDASKSQASAGVCPLPAVVIDLSAQLGPDAACIPATVVSRLPRLGLAKCVAATLRHNVFSKTEDCTTDADVLSARWCRLLHNLIDEAAPSSHSAAVTVRSGVEDACPEGTEYVAVEAFRWMHRSAKGLVAFAVMSEAFAQIDPVLPALFPIEDCRSVHKECQRLLATATRCLPFCDIRMSRSIDGTGPALRDPPLPSPCTGLPCLVVNTDAHSWQRSVPHATSSVSLTLLCAAATVAARSTGTARRTTDGKNKSDMFPVSDSVMAQCDEECMKRYTGGTGGLAIMLRAAQVDAAVRRITDLTGHPALFAMADDAVALLPERRLRFLAQVAASPLSCQRFGRSSWKQTEHRALPWTAAEAGIVYPVIGLFSSGTAELLQRAGRRLAKVGRRADASAVNPPAAETSAAPPALHDEVQGAALHHALLSVRRHGTMYSVFFVHGAAAAVLSVLGTIAVQAFPGDKDRRVAKAAAAVGAKQLSILCEYFPAVTLGSRSWWHLLGDPGRQVDNCIGDVQKECCQWCVAALLHDVGHRIGQTAAPCVRGFDGCLLPESLSTVRLGDCRGAGVLDASDRIAAAALECVGARIDPRRSPSVVAAVRALTAAVPLAMHSRPRPPRWGPPNAPINFVAIQARRFDTSKLFVPQCDIAAPAASAHAASFAALLERCGTTDATAAANDDTLDITALRDTVGTHFGGSSLSRTGLSLSLCRYRQESVVSSVVSTLCGAAASLVRCPQLEIAPPVPTIRPMVYSGGYATEAVSYFTEGVRRHLFHVPEFYLSIPGTVCAPSAAAVSLLEQFCLAQCVADLTDGVNEESVSLSHVKMSWCAVRVAAVCQKLSLPIPVAWTIFDYLV